MIATTITHPERGLVNCPAAPLLAASLRRGQSDASGRHIRLGEMVLTAADSQPGEPVTAGNHRTESGPGECGVHPQENTVLVMASYLDRTGRAAGFGAAARTDDGAAVAACAELVRRWAAVLRSRRLLVADADPDCAGARAATDAALRAAWDGPAYMLGRPVLSVGEFARLAAAGVTIVTDLDEVPDSAVVVFPAHGVPLPVRAEVAARGLRVVDATCPLAAAAHRDISNYADRGDTVVLIAGPRGSATEPVSVAEAPDSVLPVREVADIPDPRQPSGGSGKRVNPERLSVVVQTGRPVEDATAIISILRSRFPLVRGQHYDALCYAATDRAAAVRQVAASSDLVLVLGEAAEPDAAHMRAEAAAAASQSNAAARSTVHSVAAIADIESAWLTDVDTIGLILSRSARPGLVAEVCDALSGLGPLSIANRQVRTTPTQTPLPTPEPQPTPA